MSQSNQPKITMLYLPEELDDYGLDAHVFRIFVHIFRVHAETGAGCSETIEFIASKCGISSKKVSSALKTLTDCRLISKEPRIGNPSIYRPNPPEEWAKSRVGFMIAL